MDKVCAFTHCIEIWSSFVTGILMCEMKSISIFTTLSNNQNTKKLKWLMKYGKKMSMEYDFDLFQSRFTLKGSVTAVYKLCLLLMLLSGRNLQMHTLIYTFNRCLSYEKLLTIDATDNIIQWNSVKISTLFQRSIKVFLYTLYCIYFRNAHCLPCDSICWIQSMDKLKHNILNMN